MINSLLVLPESGDFTIFSIYDPSLEPFCPLACVPDAVPFCSCLELINSLFVLLPSDVFDLLSTHDSSLDIHSILACVLGAVSSLLVFEALAGCIFNFTAVSSVSPFARLTSDTLLSCQLFLLLG